ncbi:MAG TPA: acyloxyacyl hydrolase [Bacteroidia bacterium]|nr:acyloxyacyl hydrolase [Bacteroidia bacterium]
MSFAQDRNNDFFVSSCVHTGIPLLTPDNIKLVHGNPMGLELNVSCRTHGEKKWQRVYHYPEIGITFLCYDFANRSQLGQGYSIYPFVNFNITHGQKFNLRFKVATGLGYVTKKYDPLLNPENLVIGSHINGFVNLRLNAQFRLTDNFRIETGIGMTHFSNGAMMLPNAGMNIASFDLGIGYHFNSQNIKLTPDTSTSPCEHFHIVTYASMGINSISRTDHTEYLSAVYSVNLERFKGNKSKWNTGLEIVYSDSRLHEIRRDTSIHNYKNIENTQVGLKIGYAFVVGRVSVPVEMGAFIYSRPNDGIFFHRIGIRYQFSDHFIACVTLKTQWAVAYFFEWGIGYTFPIGKGYHCSSPY